MVKSLKIVVGIIMGLFMASTSLLHAQVSEIYVADPRTGVAIFGYDPVAYFDKQEAVLGLHAYEAEWRGAYWKFANAANRERFIEAPETYIPLFNGYGAYAMANGQLAEGNPIIWVIYANRLILFHSAEARTLWLDNPPQFIEAGLLNWQKLKLTLSR